MCIIYLFDSVLCKTSTIYTSSVNGFIVKYLNDTFGLNIEVVFNDDIDSYNWAFENNAEKQLEFLDSANIDNGVQNG